LYVVILLTQSLILNRSMFPCACVFITTMIVFSNILPENALKALAEADDFDLIRQVQVC
jgi:preprotein translocase subunit SecG